MKIYILVVGVGVEGEHAVVSLEVPSWTTPIAVVMVQGVADVFELTQ